MIATYPRRPNKGTGGLLGPWSDSPEKDIKALPPDRLHGTCQVDPEQMELTQTGHLGER